MNRIQILTEQAKQYADEYLLEMLDAATDPTEISVLEMEMDARTNPFFSPGAKPQFSLLSHLAKGGRIF